MKLRANKMLGLAIGERSILIAEVSAANDRCQLIRTAEFVYTAEADLQHTDVLGRALSALLKQEGFSTRAAVVGVPAKWVLTKQKSLPPVDPSLAPDVLRLQIESEFSVEIKDLVHDFAGQSSASGPSTILLVATPKQHIEQIEAIADSGRIDVQAITATSMILTAATTRGTSDAVVLSITPSSTELSAQRGVSPALLRHIGSASAATATVAGEVRRAALQLPGFAVANGNGAGNGSAGNGASTNGKTGTQIVIWDDSAPDSPAGQAFAETLGASARQGDLNLLGAGEIPAGVRGRATAISLAVAGIAEGGLIVDFLHPKLAAPKKAFLPRQSVLAIAAGVIIVIGMIFAYIDLNRLKHELADKQAELETIKDQRKAAENNVAMIKFALPWHADRVRYDGCLADLTRAIPNDGHIYLTGLSLQEHQEAKSTKHDVMDGTISGKFTNGDRPVLALLKGKEDKSFHDVNTSLDKHNPAEASFKTTFKYTPHP